MVEVTKRPRARQDLIDHAAYLYLAEPTSDVSERFLSAAEHACDRLAQMPGLGASLSSQSARLSEMRRWPVPGFRNFLIFYLPTPTGVDIVRVLHGAQDLGPLLDAE